MLSWKNLEVISAVALTFISADGPIFVASTSIDSSGFISPGMRLRISQSTGGTKYFIIVAVSNTNITLYGGTDYVLENETITLPVFSSEKSPYGFPLNPTKWTVEVKGTSSIGQGNASADTWYNLGSFNIDVPIGVWYLSWESAIDCWLSSVNTIDLFVSLSTSNDDESDPDFTAATYLGSATGNLNVMSTTHKEKVVSLEEETTFYMVGKTSIENTNLYLSGNRSPILVRATCAYL